MFALDFDDIMRMAKEHLSPRQYQIYGLYYYGKWAGDADTAPLTQYAVAKKMGVSLTTMRNELRMAERIMNPVIEQRRAQIRTVDSIPPAEGKTRFIIPCVMGGDVVDKTDTTALKAHRNSERKKHQKVG